MELEQLILLLLIPPLCLDGRIQLVVPPLPALLARPANDVILCLHDLGYLAPLLGLVRGDDLLQDGVFLGGPHLPLSDKVHALLRHR